jgi:uncharacterized protein YegP (UPF0339 family)
LGGNAGPRIWVKLDRVLYKIRMGSDMKKYHVALSFAGEDRTYVDRVANYLLSEGVKVFYDKFEETKLWGKNLYTHLSDVYENKAIFTVIFISEHYKSKLWTNHELESAQARAFEESREYILPAFFDVSVKVPGILKTTGRIDLAKKTPEELAALIVKKLEESGVEISSRFAYAEEAKADVDFPRPKGAKVTELLDAMRTYTWPRQAPAVEAVLALKWSAVTKDQIFVLGRNIYQCAVGSERRAVAILENLRSELGQLPLDAATHLLNGMFFEVYFDKEGEFRGRKLKARFLDQLLKLQTVKKFAPSIDFIRKALQPYRIHLPILPAATPEIAEFVMTVKRSDPPIVKSLLLRGHELLTIDEEEEDFSSDVWKLSFVKFTVERLRLRLAEAWSIPAEQVKITCDQKLDGKTEYRLPKGGSITWPDDGVS